MAYDGTLIRNMLPHTVTIQPYRADGLKVESDSPSLAPDDLRLINNDHIGDADCFFIVAFMKDAQVPDRIGVTQSTWMRSGSVGLGYEGTSISIGGGEGGTDYYSGSMAAGVVKLEKNATRNRFESSEKFLLVQAKETVKLDAGSDLTDQPVTREDVVVWKLVLDPDQVSRPADSEMRGW